MMNDSLSIKAKQVAEDILSRLILGSYDPYLKVVSEKIEEALLSERLECAEKVCTACRTGHALEWDSDHLRHKLASGTYCACTAGAIRIGCGPIEGK